MLNRQYDVIIVGGGPVGVALGIELGLQQVRTLILEKHDEPLQTPRAQSLSARTMEFFLRWGIDQTLEDSLLLPKSLPQVGVWCSSLCGEHYFVGRWGDNRLTENASPKAGVRIALWVTEAVLRQRLLDFPTVDLLTQHEVQDLQLLGDTVLVTAYDVNNGCTKKQQATFVACCDGATGVSKTMFNNAFNPLSDTTKMLGALFISKDIQIEKTVPDGIMYFVVSHDATAFVGPIDLHEGLWLAQVVWQDDWPDPNPQVLSALIDDVIGKKLDKTIVEHYFWNMQVQLADFFNFNNRLFWLGDAAHAFAPTGGLGLNTGFGDAQNLGWKLGAVIRKEFSPKLLSTYELERLPVCFNNLNFAKKNAEEFLKLKNHFSENNNQKEFAVAYAELGNHFLSSSGLTLGYGYATSPLTQGMPLVKHDPFKYTPQAEPGYFIPHKRHHGETIYKKLSPVHWNVIVGTDEKMNDYDISAIKRLFCLRNIHILEVPKAMYPYPYMLVRPDWHIARVGPDLQSISGAIEGQL